MQKLRTPHRPRRTSPASTLTERRYKPASTLTERRYKRFIHFGPMKPRYHLPHLDRLVANGVAFTNASIMGGSSPAVCSPLRAEIGVA